MAERFSRLAMLTSALGAAVTVDEVVRTALHQAMNIEGVVRAGLALSEGAGRELRFVSTDDESLGPLNVRWCTIDGFEDVPLARTVRTAAPVWLGTLADLEAAFPDLAPRQRILGTKSMASVPLIVEGSCVGGLLFSYDREVVHLPEHQAFLAAFAAQVAQAVNRGLAYQVQHSTSEQLQRSLMPHSLPELPGLAIGSHFQPGGVNVDVGGDWYDVLELADGSVVLTLGDVMGKGLQAAIVMSEIRAATRAYAVLDPDPATVLARLSDLVGYLPAADQVVTMLYGLIEPDRKAMRLGMAGHPPPLLVTPEGRPTVLDHEVGPALGLGSGSWQGLRVPIEDGATVLFYSDGLVETRQQDLFDGIDRLRDWVGELAPRRRNPRELCARLSQLMGTGDAEDDVTILAVTAAPGQRRASRELPADPSAAGLARRFVTSVLQDWSVTEAVVDTAQLCVSELVTNAVIHSGTTSSVTVQVDDEYVMVLVQDRGGRGAVRQPEELQPESISGRGLSLVDALTSAWSAEHSTDGTTVWFELALDPAEVDPESLLAMFS
ncbi:ATP-binding SpoIIE family protein phosphatase [Nocardioides mesophilus]|uniref:Serine/threonine-protein phosphatase n=1 Tax=Nocardioides mesophilus TaxID=433659 RepID=A0A7G9REJ1_9ACTN|nr:SpoIIE family protein phosphatase [Nocardioides mesophilus]QNN54016.1 serine/threonine-protein phosphatase [Nocardioides mesophilus]